MNTPLRSPLDRERSRLDEAPVPRRDFLGLAGLWSAAAALGLAFIGVLRLPKTAVLPTPSKKYILRPPASMPADQAYVPPGRNLAFFRDHNGAYAISLVCTHLGCIVKPAPHGFDCPCHGSVFAKDGSVVSGPAPKGLLWHYVEADENGTFLVDEGRSVPSGTVAALTVSVKSQKEEA